MHCLLTGQVTIIHVHQNMYPTLPTSILFERKFLVCRYQHCKVTMKHLLPCPITHHSFSELAECMHSVWGSHLSRKSILSKGTRKKKKKTPSPTANFCWKFGVKWQNQGWRKFLPPLLHGFYTFQKLFNVFITSVIAIAIEKQKFKNY